MTADPARLTVGVIGVGRAGSVLGAALGRAGHRIAAAHAVSEISRVRAEALLPGTALVDIPRVFAVSDLVLVAIPDDALIETTRGWARAGLVRRGQIVVHPSGRLGVSEFDHLTQAGALVIALHPAMTLTGTSVDLQRLAGCPFAVTVDPGARPIAEALVVEMGGEPVWVPQEARGLYHAALAHTANHLVTLVADGMDVLRSAGIDDPARLLAPLLTAALDNVLRTGDAALTGPVSRGDAGTVAAHVRALGAADPGILTVYRVLARRTAARAIAANRLRADDAMAILDVLADEAGGPD